MNEKIFWLLISMLDWGAAGNDKIVVEPVVQALSEKSIEEIYAFQDILAHKLFALDTRAHAEEIGEGAYVDGEYLSPDLFLYARCVVVANGEDLYQRVEEQPTAFPKNLEFEALLYIAPAAYERKTGQRYNHRTEVSFETYSNEAGWR